MSSTSRILWNHAGQHVRPQECPPSFADWLQGQPISPERQLLLDDIHKATGHLVSATKHEKQHDDKTRSFEAVLDDATCIFVNQRHKFEDKNIDAWSHRKFQSHITLLQWLSTHSTIPVPRLITLRNSGDSPFDLLITQKKKGTSIGDLHSLLPTLSKENLVRTYANIALELYKLPVPQKVGSISPTSSIDALEVIPKLGARSDFSAPRVFETLEQYLKHLFSLKRRTFTLNVTDSTVFSAQSTISQLGIHVRRWLSTNHSASLRKFVLVNDGLACSDILADDLGNVTSVLGWATHSIQPAILAAEYPPWLSYSGVNDPLFATPGKMWIESPHESVRLRQLFEEIIKENDPEYYEALIQGRDIRAAVSWLTDTNEDLGCSRMKAWMQSVFGPSPSKQPLVDDSQCRLM